MNFLSFDRVDYDFSKGNRQISRAKKPRDYSNQVVLASTRYIDVGSSDFSVRVVRNHKRVLIGAAIDSAYRYDTLDKRGWAICPDPAEHHLVALGRTYHTEKLAIRDGQVVTVRVDVARKQISYLVDGVPLGLSHTMNITDADIPKLKPVVQLCCIGDILDLA